MAQSPETQNTLALAAPPLPGVTVRELFDQHFDFMFRSLRRLGVPPGNVDDAVQEVFLVAARRLADLQPGRERSFLFATAVRIAANARRLAARHSDQHDATSLEALADRSPDPAQLADRSRARHVLDRVLDSMDLDLRTVFVLYELEEMTMTEIAATLKLPAGTVASRLRRGRDAFQSAVARLQRHA